MNTSTSNPSAAFLGQLNNTVDAYQGNPQALGAKVQSTSNKPVVQQGLVNLIALEMINNDLKAAENQVRMSLDPSQQTIAQQKENEVMGRYEADIARLEREIQRQEDIITSIRNKQAEIQTLIDNL